MQILWRKVATTSSEMLSTLIFITSSEILRLHPSPASLSHSHPNLPPQAPVTGEIKQYYGGETRSQHHREAEYLDWYRVGGQE